jgi:hypothetical protein
MISVLPEEDGPTSSIHTGGPGMSLAATVASAASTAVWSGRQCRRRTYVISTHGMGPKPPRDGISTHTPGLTISRSSLAHHCHGCGRSQRPNAEMRNYSGSVRVTTAASLTKAVPVTARVAAAAYGNDMRLQRLGGEAVASRHVGLRIHLYRNHGSIVPGKRSAVR